ncbi:monooxygenase, putative [Metarhizium acridum CQMa 102]|uniref:Monooxygenase, putative n=1 Tax=Metarhizium acridum (strain CQMa 102) TaxID=655827 RepID=E9DR20_METAQ|nr:monooxygenase, putative [Metarhizium acridum CQMa 102]EFY93698.1 monooxygenase, putative [Metarhizium acridum CQMa 102]
MKKIGQANIKFSIFEREETLNYRSNEWTMAIHWALPLLKEILPEELFAKMGVIACNPTVGIHSGLYPIIHGETGELITGVPGKGVIASFSDGSIVHGTMIIGADGPKSTVRQFAMGSEEKAAVTKFPIFHTNMTVCYNDAEKAQMVRQQYPTSYLALSQRSFHAFQSISSMPDGPDHPESWVFHMAMAWLGEVNNDMSYKERLALIKERAAGMGEPARSAFMWLPDDTEVHKAKISYWVSQAWDNRQGRVTLLGDAAHPMPPYRGQGLNHCIKDVSLLSKILKTAFSSTTASLALSEGVTQYEKEMIPRGAEEVRCSVENGLLLHDWKKIQESPVFRRGFKPVDGHNGGVVSAGAEKETSDHARVQMERDAELASTLATVRS